MSRAALCLALAVALPSAAGAQSTAPQSTTNPTRDFFSAYRARLAASRLAADNKRFTWEGRFSGDIDVFDYGEGRINFFADYTVVLGSEQRRFDPNQSLYTLDLRITRRVGLTEVAGLFSHVSRHLSDRAKVQAVDWNTAGVEVSRAKTVGQTRAEGLLRGGWVIKRSYVDYRWQFGGRVRLQRPMTSRVAFIGEGSVLLIGTDADIARRSTQTGAYAEGGVRLTGTAGSLDLILAVERRVDADPLIRGPRSWVLMGFRLVTR